MLQVTGSGTYKLIETKDNIKILFIDDKNAYSWKNANCSGDLVYLKLDTDKICCFLSVGNWRLYEIKDEPGLTNGNHFELNVGKGKWQGYLLPKGFPTPLNKRAHISQTSEIITKVKRR